MYSTYCILLVCNEFNEIWLKVKIVKLLGNCFFIDFFFVESTNCKITYIRKLVSCRKRNKRENHLTNILEKSNGLNELVKICHVIKNFIKLSRKIFWQTKGVCVF